MTVAIVKQPDNLLRIDQPQLAWTTLLGSNLLTVDNAASGGVATLQGNNLLTLPDVYGAEAFIPRVSRTPTLYAPGITRHFQLTLVASTPTLYGVSVDLPINISPPLVSRTPTLLAPTVVPGTANVLLQIVRQIPVVRGLTATPGLREVLLTPVTRTPTAFGFGTVFGPIFPLIQRVVRIPQVFVIKGGREADTVQEHVDIVQRVLEGYAGPVEMTHHLIVSDKFGNELRPLPDWDAASIEMSNFTDATWKLSLTARQTDAFDPESDYLTAVVDLKVGDTTERFYMGQYVFMARSYTYSEQLRLWGLEGRSPEELLAQDSPTAVYTVPVDAPALTTVRDILVTLGVPNNRINFPTDDKNIPNGLVFNPTDENEEKTWLRICNDILGSCGFAALKTDRFGKFFTYELGDPMKAPPDVIYGPTEILNAENFIGEEATDDWDYERFANRIVVISSDVNQDPPLVAVAENHNPNSRASIERLGRIRTKRVTTSTASSLEDMQRIADAELIKASGFYRRSTIKTLKDPRRKPVETYEAYYKSENELVISDRWAVTNWKWPHTDASGVMEHEISRVESL